MSHPVFETPKQHLDILLHPEPQQIIHDLKNNRNVLSNTSIPILNKPLSHWRTQCRSELLQAAFHFSGKKGVSVPVVADESPLIVAGHQCQPFHPGIFSKYILADCLAKSQHGIAFNLAVDSDLPKDIDLRIPVETESGLQFKRIPLADVLPDLPMEYQPAISAEQVEVLIRQLKTLTVSSDLRDHIGHVCDYLRRRFSYADNLAALVMLLNHHFADEHDVHWLDLPVSAMSKTRCFSAFACDLISRDVEVRQYYNHALADYRSEHKIKNKLQPMPDLAGGDLPDEPQESLFWIFRKDRQRLPLYMRRCHNAMVMSDGQNDIAAIPYTDDLNSERFIDLLIGVQKQHQFSLRPRATALTLFVRLFLADIFIHGIGGARYDVITDMLMEKLYPIRPPAYAVASATCYLYPSDTPNAEELRQIDRQLRDLKYHPLNLLDQYSQSLTPDQRCELEQLILKKQRCLTRNLQATGNERQKVFTDIHRLNDHITALLGPIEKQLKENKQRVQNQVNLASIREAREVFFGLFDGETIEKLKQKFDIPCQ